jgi:hypothetical protein
VGEYSVDRMVERMLAVYATLGVGIRK